MRFPSESASFFCALGVKFIKTLGAYFAISHMLSALDADSPDSSENAPFWKTVCSRRVDLRCVTVQLDWLRL